MQVKLPDISNIVRVNELPEVKSSVMLDSTNNVPVEDGIFSYEIFGYPGEDKRRKQWAYVDLGGHFIHPLVYKIIISTQRNIGELISGRKKFVVKNGELVESEDGKTGIKFLYNKWSEIKWKQKGDSSLRSTRIKLLTNTPKNKIFVSKWLIIPPFTRDIDFGKIDRGVLGKDELNDHYTKLINKANGIKSIENSGGASLQLNLSKSSLQKTLIDIYEYLIGKNEKKRGAIRKGLLGKTVDYSARLIISCRHHTDPSPENSLVSFEKVGISVAHIVSIFYPFVINRLVRSFEELFENYEEGFYIDNDIQKRFKFHDDAVKDFTQDELKQKIKLFISSPEFRFSPILIKAKNGKRLPTVGNLLELNREMTWIDLLYVICCDVVRDKHVLITRYPIEQYQNIFCSKINVMTTKHTISRIIHGKHYPFYPDLKKGNELTQIDTLQMSNSYLSSMGADFDGDMVSVRGIFTDEANKEAEEIIYKKLNILNGVGGSSRTLGNEGSLGLYQLTKA